MRPFLHLALTVTALFCATGYAGAGEAWRATKVAGEVRVEMAGAPAVPLTIAMAIAAEATIETAASGSATLVRGEERVLVAPNSRLRLPPPEADGFTRIIAEFGELFFQVGKKASPHFRVETPLLAAVVKGTSFSVSVDHEGAHVDVSDGLVLVQNSASADETYVGAGRTARVMIAQPLTLYLDHNIVPPSNMRLKHADDLAPTLSDADQAPRSTAPASAAPSTTRRATIAQAASSGIAFTAPSAKATRSPASLVVDSTLTGVGFGIIAAALAIVLIGANWRRPGIGGAKAKRGSKHARDQG